MKWNPQFMHRVIQLTPFPHFLFYLFIYLFIYFGVFFCPSVDPCHRYKTLNSSDRNIKTTSRSPKKLCDSINVLPSGGWYRFQGAAGTRLPTECPQSGVCQTNSPGWLNVKSKPLPPEGVTEKSIRVCFKFGANGNCCDQQQLIHIKNCSSYFVYKLYHTPKCDLRYCGTDWTKQIHAVNSIPQRNDLKSL